MVHVNFHVQNMMFVVGEDHFLHSLFSTIAYRLEPAGWGSRFPVLMNELYQGRLSPERVPQALRELAQIRDELARLPPEARVYAYEDPDRPTPWPVPPGAESVADCFVSSRGDNVLGVLEAALDDSEEAGAALEIRPLDTSGTYTYFVTGER